MSRTSLSVPLYKSRLEDVKMNSKEISLISIFAALYAIGVVFLAPFSFLPVQIRIADSFQLNSHLFTEVLTEFIPQCLIPLII